MPTHKTLTDQWLATVLSEMGDSHEQVAETLRNAQIKGQQGDLHDCPIARYIASRVREHAPSHSVTVTVCGSVVTVAIFDDGFTEISADAPEPVREFVATFDNAEFDHDLYADLVESSGS